MSEQVLLNALHGIQLWGIVGQSMDPSIGKLRCGSNDEFLAAYKALENEVGRLISENERLRQKDVELRDKMETFGTCSGAITALFVEGIKEQEAENAKLRELILDMLVDEERGHNDDGTYYEHVRLAKELGIEAS